MMTSVACSAPKLRSLFDAIAPEPEDSLLRLIGMHARDPRPDKIDLGVGVFRDERGHTPVLKAVKAAEADLVENEPSKSYLGARGDIGFVELLSVPLTVAVAGMMLAAVPACNLPVEIRTCSAGSM